MNIDLPAVAAVLALGFVAGILSGMFGIGGGLVIVPALFIVFGIDQKTATGTSLFALMWPVGLLGVVEYWKAGRMDPWKGGWIAVGLFFGAYFGARITLALPPTTMKRAYAVFLLVVGTYFLLGTKPGPAAGKKPATATATEPVPSATPGDPVDGGGPPAASSGQVH